MVRTFKEKVNKSFVNLFAELNKCVDIEDGRSSPVEKWHMMCWIWNIFGLCKQKRIDLFTFRVGTRQLS